MDSENQVKALIGTSSHSIESALKSFQKYQPDYYFVGTCYLTQSHPEKSDEADLEGPQLPGKVKQALLDNINSDIHSPKNIPKMLAIGGISIENCDEPISFGADGAATIRTVLQANDPAKVVSLLKTTMKMHNMRPQQTNNKE